MKHGKGPKKPDDWKRSFVTKLTDVKSQWSSKFEEALDRHVSPTATRARPDDRQQDVATEEAESLRS